MKIKINSIMKNVYGEPLKSQRKKERSKKSDKPVEFEDMLLKDAMVNSLLAEIKDDPLTGDEKLERYRLAMKIQDAKTDLDLTSKEIVLIKDMIAKVWSPLISGQAWEMIEP